MEDSNKYAKIDFKAKVKPIKPVNPEFDLVKIYVQSVGCNRNMTYMSKENIQKFLPTLDYAPVVGHIIKGVNKETGEEMLYVGGHDSTIDWDTFEFVDLTVPYGTVMPNTYDWEIVNEYGKDVEYLTANAILWTGRYENLKECIYSEDVWFNQSMELLISQFRPYEKDSNYTELLEWTYSALCLLGKADEDSTTGHTDPEMHTEPAFISACVKPVEFAKSEFAELMEEMKDKISFALSNQSSDESESTTEEVDIENNENGGKSMTEEVKNEVVEEVTEPVVEKETVEETVTNETVENTVEEPTEKDVEESTPDEVTEEATEETTDESVEDFSTKYAELKEAYDALEKEFADYKEAYSTPNAEVEDLKEYKANKEFEERKVAEDAVFAKYEENIGETDEFASLKDNASDYSIDALEKECLCIVGKYAIANKTENKETKPFKFSLGGEQAVEVETDPYGGLMTKYNKKKMEER